MLEQKSRNRFEKLKSMSMKDLASLFCKFLSCYYCPGANVPCENRCKEYWLDWLEEEIADA